MNETIADKTKQAVDNVAGFGTSDKAEGTVREAVGHGQKAVGEATGDHGLQAEGTSNQVAGNAQQVVGEVKEGASNIAENIKQGVSNLLEDAKEALHKKNNPV